MSKLQAINEHLNIIMQLEKICNGQKLSTVKKYRDICLSVDAYEQQGAKKSAAITWTADEFGVSEVTVYKALEFGLNKRPNTTNNNK